MLELRRDREIFAEEGGWFHARWHFSFDHYRDPEQMGVGALRVFNDDRIVAGAQWPGRGLGRPLIGRPTTNRPGPEVVKR